MTRPDVTTIRKHAHECVEPQSCPYRHWQITELLDYIENLQVVVEALRAWRSSKGSLEAVNASIVALDALDEKPS